MSKPRDAPGGAVTGAYGGLRRLWMEFKARAVGHGVAGGLLSAFGVKIAAILVLYLAQMVLARALGSRAYGEYFYAYSWFAALLPFASAGVHNAALSFVPSYAVTGRAGLLRGFLVGGSGVALATGVALAAVGLLVLELLGSALESGLARSLRLVALALPLAAVGSLHETSLRALKLILRGQVPPEILRPVLTTGLVLLASGLGWAGATAPLAAGSLLVATVLTVALSVGFMIARLAPEIGRVRAHFRLREWLGLALHMVGLTAFLALMNRVDVLTLGAMMGAERAGFYGLGAQLTAVIGFSLHTLNLVVVPMIGEASARAELPRIERFLRLGTICASGISLALVVGLGLFGRSLLATYGPGFPAAFPAMLILAGGQLLYVAIGPSVFVLCLTGRQRQALLFAICGAGLNAVLNPFAIAAFGMVGAASATALSTGVWAWLNLRATRSSAGINPSVFPVRRGRSGIS